MSSAKEKFLSVNTLAGVVQQCVGSVTTIELRNEAYVTGHVVDVDGFMNVTVQKAKFTDPSGRQKAFESFFVQNRLIRGVQIPTKIDLRKAVQNVGKPPSKPAKLAVSKNRAFILKKRAERNVQDAQNAAAAKTTSS
jgi:small nuclear ribonucleoprotein (snRNP)-like protein